MKPEQREFLNLRHFPGVLSRQQAAWRLGVEEHEIDILSNAGKLTALGNPKKNCKRVWGATEIERCVESMEWLNAAQKTITAWWYRKNKSRLSKHNVTPSHALTQNRSSSIQRTSPERERNSLKHGGNQKRNGKGSGGSDVLNGFHDNGYFQNSTSSNE